MNPPNRIRELRKRANMSQTELAMMVGLTQGQVGHLENGQRNLTLEWMRRIARALNVAVSELLVDADVPDRLAEDERKVVEAMRVADPESRWHMAETLEALVAVAKKRRSA